MTGDGLVQAAAVAGAVVFLGGLIWRGFLVVRRAAGRVDDIVDDWQGTPPRPGVPARPGLMERVAAIEETTATTAAETKSLAERVARIEHELQPNSGRSLRDAVDRVDRRTAQIAPEE